MKRRVYVRYATEAAVEEKNVMPKRPTPEDRAEINDPSRKDLTFKEWQMWGEQRRALKALAPGIILDPEETSLIDLNDLVYSVTRCQTLRLLSEYGRLEY